MRTKFTLLTWDTEYTEKTRSAEETGVAVVMRRSRLIIFS